MSTFQRTETRCDLCGPGAQRATMCADCMARFGAWALGYLEDVVPDEHAAMHYVALQAEARAMVARCTDLHHAQS